MLQEIAIPKMNFGDGKLGRLSSLARQADDAKYTLSTVMNGNRISDFSTEARRGREKCAREGRSSRRNTIGKGSPTPRQSKSHLSRVDRDLHSLEGQRRRSDRDAIRTFPSQSRI